MESRVTASCGEALGGGGTEQKGKGLMAMDNSVVIAGGKKYKGKYKGNIICKKKD